MPNGWVTRDRLYEYNLKNNEGISVASGFKRAWCIQDHSTFRCNNQGISVGDHDTYGADQNCQFLPIDDLGDGEYVFEITVNPKRKFIEDNYDDNKLTKRIKIDGIVVREIKL